MLGRRDNSTNPSIFGKSDPNHKTTLAKKRAPQMAIKNHHFKIEVILK
jgi:hypothetical protein